LFLLSNHFLDGSALEEADSFGWQVRLWSGLIAHLKGQEELCNSEGVYQYLLYLCEACRTMPVKEMRFDRRSLQSLCYFANLIEELVNSASNNQFQYGIYRTVRTNESGWYGFYYELRDKVSDKAAWPYFGIEFYDEEPVRIAIGFERDWNRVFQRLPEAFNNAACEDIEVIGPDHPEGSEHRFVCRMAPGTY